MNKRTLGSTGLQIAPVVFGGNVFGWTADEATSFSLLDALVERGFNTIDTANVYSVWVPGHQGGESESILGRWFKRSGKRGEMVLASKVGMQMGDGTKGLSKENILRSVEASLTRLQTDYLDLYWSHKDDEETPLEETLEAYGELLAQGKIRSIGASNYKGARVVEALKVAAEKKLPAYATLQPEYNLFDRQEYETDIAPVAAETGLYTQPYFSLASGFLTGKYKSIEESKGTKRAARVEKYFTPRGQKILDALGQVAAETGAAQASIALAWLMAQPTVAAPIASATKLEQLDALFEAASLTLTAAQLDGLTSASAW